MDCARRQERRGASLRKFLSAELSTERRVTPSMRSRSPACQCRPKALALEGILDASAEIGYHRYLPPAMLRTADITLFI